MLFDMHWYCMNVRLLMVKSQKHTNGNKNKLNKNVLVLKEII